MEKPTVLDLIDMLTMSLGEISSVADNLAEILFINNNVDKNLYKSAYAIKTMIDNLEKKSVVLCEAILNKQ